MDTVFLFEVDMLGRHLFRLQHRGKTLLTSRPYVSRGEVCQAIVELRGSVALGCAFSRQRTTLGDRYFLVRTTTGALLAVSTCFDDDASMELAILELEVVVPDAQCAQCDLPVPMTLSSRL